ncbi:MAG TPA: PHP domain-containing protein [Levilinea sp.]|nr:PHP domain-containing protein [Levilinea sp.]
MGFADLHVHSIHSYDATSSIPAILKYVADQTDLDVIAITDHDTLVGVREAMLLAPRYGVEVIPGCEISTLDGHLLALYITERIPPGLSLAETIRQVGRQGGLCIAPHPEAKGTSSLSGKIIQDTLRVPQMAQVLVGVEVFNGGLVYTRSNHAALRLVESLQIARVGNSDSHILQTLGEGSTEFSGNTAADLRRALEAHATTVRVGKGLQGAQALRYWLPKYIMRNMGWVTWNDNPDLPLRYARMKTVMSHTLAEERSG